MIDVDQGIDLLRIATEVVLRSQVTTGKGGSADETSKSVLEIAEKFKEFINQR